LARFIHDDLQPLHQLLSSRTRHIFNLDNANENGAFLSLVQHHGYPTPLLDWTYSPYVAAFFAYRTITREHANNTSGDERVRVFVFDQALWKANLPQILTLNNPHLHVSFAEFIAIENERLVPQQSASLLTNIDDIEWYIRDKESEHVKYLWAVDLPVRERDKVMRELRFMGITAGSLFPGLDGACEDLKERNFDEFGASGA
jgi:hypothetical protein